MAASFRCIRRLTAPPGLLLWLLLASGCSLTPPLTLPANRLANLPPRQELTATPFIRQDDYQCGPASLAMILGFHGNSLTPAELVPWVFTPDAQGSFPAEMDAVTRQQGFVSYPLERLEEVLAEVAAGHPVLVLQNLATDWYPRWHFAVVVGYDLSRQELVLRSGDLPRRITEFMLFETTWARSRHWARVILPPDTLPASAQPQRWLQAAADLEQTGPAPAALQAFLTAVQRWPEQPLAHFGLASRLLASGDATHARARFETLLRLQPDLAAGWNNYAYALRDTGCPAAARTAIACAVALEPANPAFADSRRELTATPLPDRDHPHCAIPACPVSAR